MYARDKDRLVRVLVGALLQSSFTQKQLAVLLQEIEIDSDLWMRVSEATMASLEVFGKGARIPPRKSVRNDNEDMQFVYQLVRNKRISIKDMRDRALALNPTLSISLPVSSMKALLNTIRSQLPERGFQEMIEDTLDSNTVDPYLKGIMRKDR